MTDVQAVVVRNPRLLITVGDDGMVDFRAFTVSPQQTVEMLEEILEQVKAAAVEAQAEWENGTGNVVTTWGAGLKPDDAS